MGFHVLDANGCLKTVPRGLSVVSGKVLTVSNTLTVEGADGSTLKAVVTKTDTGDPAGSEGLLVINTFDNTFKAYADGAWRTLASGW